MAFRLIPKTRILSSLGDGNMAVVMRGINKVTKRNGAVYYYHRATGTRLKGEPGSLAFIQSYADAESGVIKARTGTFSGLVREFERSADWTALAPSTQAEYRRILKAIEDEYGTAPFAALERSSFRVEALKWRDRHAQKSPREADNRITVLARVMAWGVDRGHLQTSVLKDVRRVYRSDRSEIIWLPEHIESFCEVAPVELQYAMMLALHTGQRQGDLVRLTWNAYDGSAISLRQGKTGTRVVIKCTRALKEMLDGMPKRAAIILTTTTGRPWRGKNLQHRWAAAMAAAKIEGLHFHDLRGTAVTMLAEAGCTHQEIAAVTGHSLRYVGQIVDRYLARTRVLADHAIVKLENAGRTELANFAANRPMVGLAK